MAFSSLKFVSSLLLLIAAASLLISPATSQTCKSQKFAPNTTFANCADLPTLNAFLHWTYDSSAKPNPTLTFAFIAPPATPHGWVAWALNPTAMSMAGSQALIAFRDASGSVVVKTYNIQSYNSLVESPISYKVLSKRAEFSGGVFRMFATLGLPEAGAAEMEVNHVWQVGPSVTNGVPSMHALEGDNLSSSDTLRLVSTAAPPKRSSGRAAPPAPAPTSSRARRAPVAPTGQAPTGSVGNAPPAPAINVGNAPPAPARAPAREISGNDNGSSSMARGSGFYGILVLLGLFLGF